MDNEKVVTANALEDRIEESLERKKLKTRVGYSIPCPLRMRKKGR